TDCPAYFRSTTFATKVNLSLSFRCFPAVRTEICLTVYRVSPARFVRQLRLVSPSSFADLVTQNGFSWQKSRVFLQSIHSSSIGSFKNLVAFLERRPSASEAPGRRRLLGECQTRVVLPCALDEASCEDATNRSLGPEPGHRASVCPCSRFPSRIKCATSVFLDFPRG